MIYLGRISYGLYVFHGLALVLVVHACKSLPPSEKWALFPLLALAVTILLAAASYQWLELPFLRLKKRFQHVQSR